MIRAALLVLAAALVLAALFFARPHATAGPPMRDFEAYYAAGSAWRHGADPYGSAIWESERVLPGVSARRSELLPFVGPPATLPVWSAFSRLPFDTANIVWRGVLLAALAILVLVALRLAGIALTAPAFLAAAVFALGFGPVTSCIALGQIALPAFACTALALVLPAAGIFAWMQPNVALTLASQATTRNGALLFAGSAAIFGFGCLAIAGPQGIAHYGAVLQAHVRAEQFSAIQITPGALAYGFGANEKAARVFGVLAALTSAGAWLWILRSVGDRVARFCATCALLPIAILFFHEHDLVVTFVAALYFPMRCNVRFWPLACVGALLCATDWLGLAQRPDGAVQTLLLIGAAGLALFVMRRDLHPRALLAPTGVLALIGIAAMYAQGHPAPVWPDALHALPAMRGSDPAGVWHAEQLASGLLQADPFWALLRCASLAGCVTLVYACILSSRSPVGSKSPLPAPA
jgi:hypothetical protein